MFIDFRSADADTGIRCDICIIGAGAAGITLARALRGSGIDVCVLESGGLETSPPVQALYTGVVAGLQNADPLTCRLRYFGGTTNHWAGWCAPLQDIDFRQRAWVPGSGWPLQRSEILPWYARARDVCELGSPGFGAAALRNPEHNFSGFPSEKLNVNYFRFSPPTRFGQVYRDALAEADNVRVLLNANVLALETGTTPAEVREVRIRTLAGKSGVVRAGVVVLAAGGMENARLLLLSNRVQTAGLGNASGLVGRYFMQHIEGVVARILAVDPAALARDFSRYTQQGVKTRAELSLSARVQEEVGILNTGFTIDANPIHGAGYLALRDLWRSLRDGDWPEDFTPLLQTVLSDIGSVGEVWDSPDQYEVSLYARAEALPNAASRISLSDSRDVFGLPRIRVDWQLTPFDKRSLCESVRTVAEEFGRRGLGRFELADWVMPGNSKWPQPLWGGCHHMGTTRMSEDADAGVVDRDCRVHGVGNLYVAGSSVFPTGGYVPPTLTVVALALRLADHLKRQFQSA